MNLMINYFTLLKTLLEAKKFNFNNKKNKTKSIPGDHPIDLIFIEFYIEYYFVQSSIDIIQFKNVKVKYTIRTFTWIIVEKNVIRCIY